MPSDVRNVVNDVRNVAIGVRNMACDIRNVAKDIRNLASDVSDGLWVLATLLALPIVFLTSLTRHN